MRFFNFVALGMACLLAPAQANAAWHEVKSRHFAIYGDAAPDWLRRYALKLEAFDAAVRELRGMDDPEVGDGGRVTIYLLPDTDDVSKLATGKKTSIAGFYINRASGSVAFVPRKAGSQEWDLSAESTLFHEYAHHLMFQATDAAFPPWMVEGFAEFYTNAEFERGGTVRLGMPATHRTIGLYLLPKPTMETLLGPGIQKGDAETFDTFYGWSWVLIHYLRFAEDRKGQLERYIADLRAGKELIPAAQAAFGDLRQLQRDMNLYLHRNKFKNFAVALPAPSPESVAVRPLTAGEAAIMPQRLLSERGVDSKTAPAVAAAVRAKAAAYPADARVLRALAEAEYDAGNHSAAERAATRATEIDPSLREAWIYRGRAQMAIARDQDKADWSAIRANFLKANKLDPEDAEPLWRYYESFGAAGEAPTKNAKEGLDYALTLSPQDDGLRMTVVYQRIADGRLAEARQAIGPLAFAPHGGGRERAMKVLLALEGNDASAALAALREAPKDAEGALSPGR